MESKKFTIILLIIFTGLCTFLYFKKYQTDTALVYGQRRAAEAKQAAKNLAAITKAGASEKAKTPAVAETVSTAEKASTAEAPKADVAVPQAAKTAPEVVEAQQVKAPEVKSPEVKKQVAKKQEVKTSVSVAQTPVFEKFYIYANGSSPENNFYPFGYMGDVRALKVEQNNKDIVYSGSTSIKITYKPDENSGGAWSGVYWQQPANNWGDRGAGFNLSGANLLTFWARGEQGGEVVNNFIVGGISGKKYEDTDMRSIGPVELSTEWVKYSIDLSGADLSNIIGGFCVTFTKSSNPQGAVIFLDEIVFE
jgi:hypothetical protein